MKDRNQSNKEKMTLGEAGAENVKEKINIASCWKDKIRYFILEANTKGH